jgi:protein O-GlcNAc transferase
MLPACYRNRPALANARYNLGCLLASHGRTDEAIACHQTAIAAPPRFAACMANLPILYRSEAEVQERRQHYAAALEALVTLEPAQAAAAIGTSQPFFLPYQQQDDRALQALYGQFACRVLAATEPPAVPASPPAPGERIRLGIVSGFFCDHTLYKLFLEGWLTQIDRSRFEVIGLHTGRVADTRTARCAAWCDRFVQGLPASSWRDAILSIAPHVLLYPEIGMDPIAGRLAAMRLARVQCVAWGQPVTSGMPTIDWFLSSALMEPDDADAFYTERLVRLPNLGLFYTPDPVEDPLDAAKRARFGLDPLAPVFWSGQALYKYLPQYDVVFPRIAARLGACQFVFIGFAKSQAVTEAFRARLEAAFAAAGLDAARHVVILPPMSQRDYLQAVGTADAILDTIGWSGGRSTLDCLVQNPAIVTMPGRFLRGRHTAAILRRIGCEQTIAESLEDYVSIAVRLARDPAWRAEARQAVATGKHCLFQDVGTIRALEDFLAEAVTQEALI